MKLTCEVKVNKYLYITIRGSALHSLNFLLECHYSQLDNLQLKMTRRSKTKIKDAKATHNITVIFKNEN